MYSGIALANDTALSPQQLSQAGYSVGYMLGKNAQKSAPDLAKADILAGLSDAYSGKSTLSVSQIEKILLDYQQYRLAVTEKDRQFISYKNLQLGKDFLAQNAKKSGVITTKSGLQYEILTQGKGKKPKATATVSVRYEGKTLDGKVFDSTAQHGGKPAIFPLNDVIPGWMEGLQLMPAGSTYRFYIPADLAYGEAGAPEGGIEPNSVLIFDVTLVEIK